KKGLYVVAPDYSKMEISRELIANHLYGPSYLSLESALSYYGLIPERVYNVRSVTAKRARKYSTPLGAFEYRTVPVDYFPIGIQQEETDSKSMFLIAAPEKALCDMIVLTSGLRLQSEKAVDRKSTRLNSSHVKISYAVFCLKKKKKQKKNNVIENKKKEIKREQTKEDDNKKAEKREKE